MSENKQGYAERLRELAAEGGYSLSSLSLAAGLGKGAVSDLLAHPDRAPRERTLRALAEVLDVDPAYLAGRSDQRRAAAGWAEGIGSADDAVRDGIQAIVDGSGGRLRAFHQTGGPGEATSLVDTSEPPSSGQLVFVIDGNGAAIRYLAEPYLIATDPQGGVSHRLRGDDVQILGRVIATIRHH